MRKNENNFYQIKKITIDWMGDNLGGPHIKRFKKHYKIFRTEIDKQYQKVPLVSQPTAGRNDPCPCGSGKKFKKCCLN